MESSNDNENSYYTNKLDKVNEIKENANKLQKDLIQNDPNNGNLFEDYVETSEKFYELLNIIKKYICMYIEVLNEVKNDKNLLKEDMDKYVTDLERIIADGLNDHNEIIEASVYCLKSYNLKITSKLIYGMVEANAKTGGDISSFYDKIKKDDKKSRCTIM
jgi:hypothetical protein